MERNQEKRTNPEYLLKGVKTVVVVAINYFADKSHSSPVPIARYARPTEDYHSILRSKLKVLLACLKEQVPTLNGRCLVDTAPFLERAWAVEAGIGVIGKNTCLIIPNKGSWFLLGELLLDIALPPDPKIEKDICNECTLCLTACPGKALTPYSLNASTCFSYLTQHERLPNSVRKPTSKTMIFGCDTCQEACPHNRHTQPTKLPEMQPNTELLSLSKMDWKELTSEDFQEKWGRSALAYSGLNQIQRNVK